VRDTEMMIGAFQPRHAYDGASSPFEGTPSAADKPAVSTGASTRGVANANANGSGESMSSAAPSLPRGEVSRFRKRLWAEHALGPQANEFPCELEDPGTLQCVRAMQRIGRQNWERYAGDEVVEMDTHLLLYPYTVAANGDVSATVPLFPDTRGAVLGTSSSLIPNILAS
jgi:hypothetical protein